MVAARGESLSFSLSRDNDASHRRLRPLRFFVTRVAAFDRIGSFVRSFCSFVRSFVRSFETGELDAFTWSVVEQYDEYCWDFGDGDGDNDGDSHGGHDHHHNDDNHASTDSGDQSGGGGGGGKKKGGDDGANGGVIAAAVIGSLLGACLCSLFFFVFAPVPSERRRVRGGPPA